MTEKEQQFLDGIHAELSKRKRSQFRIAHTLHDARGYTVLDVNVTAPTFEEAKRKTLAKLSTIDKNSVLPCAPKDRWGVFMLALFVSREIVPSPFGKRGLIGFYIREAL